MLPVIFRGHHEAGFFAHALSLNPEGSLLRPLPDNQRTEEARYACLIVVKDYYRMRAASSKEWHYKSIEPEILDDVRAGRAILVLDLTNEGPVYDREIFNELYAWIEYQDLPSGRVTWLSQNRLLATQAAEQAGARSKLVDFDCYDYFVKIMAWHFSPWGKHIQAQPDSEADRGRPTASSNKDKWLLCLNATPRLSRVLAVAALQHQSLIRHSLVSFPGMQYVKTGVSLSEVYSFLKANPRLEYLREAVAQVSTWPSLTVDSFTEQGNDLVEKIDASVYERSFFSLVTESDFAEGGIQRITEKSVKAFCMGHPTVILGNPHSIEILRSFGFHDWSDTFDRSSETIVNPALRFEKVLEEVKRQVVAINDDPMRWLASAGEVTRHNQRHARSGAFLRNLVSTMDKRLVEKFTAVLN